jgi:hypothetical protein
VLSEALLDLHAELTRRREDQRARSSRAAKEAVYDRQRECRRFAGTGLRQADQVAPLESEGDRLLLDRRRRLVAGVFDRAQ